VTDALSWAPKRSVFIRRAVFGAAFTTLCLTAVGVLLSLYLDLSLIWTLPTALFLTAGFLFDDALRWQGSKHDRWEIKGGQLVHSGSDGIAHVPLSDIARVFTRAGGRVVIELTSGQRVALRYLPYPDETARAITAALPR